MDVVGMETGEDVVVAVVAVAVGREGEGAAPVVPDVVLDVVLDALVAVDRAVAVAGARVVVAVVPASTCRTPLPSLPSGNWRPVVMGRCKVLHA